MFQLKIYPIFILFLLIFLNTSLQAKQLNFYNWSDYIAPDTIKNFQQKTGINVTYDVFDSNEVLDSKLMAGNTGFDVVMPTDSFLARQLHAHIYMPLDKDKLPNYEHLDPKFLKMMEKFDPKNLYAIPYMWQSTGIGFDVDKVKQILGENVSLDSWDLLFNEENIKKLSQCGVAFLDAPSEIFPTVLNYLGKDPNSKQVNDYYEAANLLTKIRPYITYFHSSKYINDLADGDICVAIGWSGDFFQAARAAKNAGQKKSIHYLVPKEGAIITFDALAIPNGAKNSEEAYQFLNYLLEPKVIANITNHIFYPNANKDAKQYLDNDVINNPAIYPPEDVLARLFPIKEQSPKIDRLMVRLWTKVLSGF